MEHGSTGVLIVRSEAFDDGGVGQAAGLAHGLQAVALRPAERDEWSVDIQEEQRRLRRTCHDRTIALPSFPNRRRRGSGSRSVTAPHQVHQTHLPIKVTRGRRAAPGRARRPVGDPLRTPAAPASALRIRRRSRQGCGRRGGSRLRAAGLAVAGEHHLADPVRALPARYHPAAHRQHRDGEEHQGAPTTR
jgi:hypothetical protein